MKKALLLFLTGFLIQFGVAQTASNFNCNDCSSINHDLFTELDAGKVIVIAWVMPCSNCISGALSGYSAVQSFSNSNPGQVLFYLADDVANTSCATLQSWANTNSMPNAVVFSNAAVSMGAYGAAGMPKVIVVGGNSHTVYYNVNGSGSINTAGVQTAINNALAANATAIKENDNVFSSLSIYPNPNNSSSTIFLKLSKETKIKVEVLNQLGQKVLEAYNGNLPQGENTLKINTADLNNGNYFINITDGESSKKVKMIILR